MRTAMQNTLAKGRMTNTHPGVEMEIIKKQGGFKRIQGDLMCLNYKTRGFRASSTKSEVEVVEAAGIIFRK